MPDIIPGIGLQKMAPLSSGRADVDTSNALFSDPQANSATTRCPTLIKAANGDLLLFTEFRAGVQDYQVAGIMMKRSTDGGASFGKSTLIYNRADYIDSQKWMNCGCPVMNKNGRIFMHFTHSDGASTALAITTAKWIKSDDNGLTWSATTDISSAVIKANNTTPASLPACYLLNNQPWYWYRYGPSPGYCDPTSGQMIVTANHRYSKDQSTDIGFGVLSFANSVISNDDGATWFLGGGVDETVAANRASNEGVIVRLSTGDYFFSCRIVSGGTFADSQRGQSTITTAQLTGTWPTLTASTPGAGSIPVQSCQGSLIKAANGDLWLVVPTNNTTRATHCVFRSTDNGATFATKRFLWYGLGGYSTTYETSSGNFLTIFEATDDAENAATDSTTYNQMLRITRWSTDWFINESTYPAVATYYLNDGILGAATVTTATELGCWEGYGPPGKGGAAVTWDASSLDTGGITFSGAGNGLQVQSIQTGEQGGMWDSGLLSITYEFIVKFDTTAVTWVLFDNRAGAGKGFTLTINAGVVSAAMSDGTTARTAGGGSSVVGSGVYHNIAVQLTRGSTLKVYVDGVQNISTADTMSASLGVVGTAIARVGSLTGGGSPAPATTSLRMMRVTHKPVSPANMLAVNVTKPSVAVLNGFTTTAITLPSTTGLKLALFAPGFGGPDAYGSVDRWGGISWPNRVPADGTGVGSFRDRSSLRAIWGGLSAATGSWWLTDTEFGRHVRLQRASPNSATSSDTDKWQRQSGITTDYDFIQNTGIFSFLCTFNIIADRYGTTMVIFCNNNATGGQAGFCFQVNSTPAYTINAQVSDGVTSRLNEAMAGAISFNRWYFAGVTSSARGVNCQLYKGLYTAGTCATLTQAPGATPMAGSDATYNSTSIATVGVRPNFVRGCDIKLGPMLMFNRALSPSEMQAWANVMNKEPLFDGSDPSPNLGLGLGL